MATAKKKAAPDSVSRFTVEGKPYELDMDALTWGEIEDLEVYFNASFADVDIESGRGAMFLAYLAVRRKRPTFTLDMIRAMQIDSVVAVDRPTEAPATDGSPDS